MRVMVLVVLLLLLVPATFGATIHGDVYDFSLEHVENARVTVNTTPHQLLIAKDGMYSVDIPNGFYQLKAELVEDGVVVASEIRNVTVRGTGSYVIDFILLPDFGTVDAIAIGPDVSFPESDDVGYNFIVLIVLLLIGIVLFFIHRRISRKGALDSSSKNKDNNSNEETDSKNSAANNEKDEELDNGKSNDEKKTKNPENDLDLIVSIIRKEGGRTTQKEIRKHIPLSEAKISLMIAELEHKGIVTKIKKGRGNIIILKK